MRYRRRVSSSEIVTPPAASAASPFAKVLAALRTGGAFLVVGALGFLVDAGTYNLLVFWGGHGVLYHAPLPAKIIAIAVATVVTYFGNKWWTFAHKKGGSPAREYLLYAVFNVIAIGLQLGCLGFSRYVLHLSTPLSDNISGTLIGQIVAVVFRYWAYDKFVFTGESAARSAGDA
ncbi:GtrA family protein [Nocardia terpenica]|nr:GtrA family protein [Nocardia terpenica]MBF6108105.1 GtrA family protein [Nocardia terpenica]MBF6115320.1 GtrA family protein [Nocardia terpenica]MBF6122642.1 GtrA family protein [Nocardia terpenica]